MVIMSVMRQWTESHDSLFYCVYVIRATFKHALNWHNPMNSLEINKFHYIVNRLHDMQFFNFSNNEALKGESTICSNMTSQLRF